MEVKIIKHQFISDTGPIEYERVAITGQLNGEDVALELKCTKSELMIVKALIAEEN